MPYIRSISVYQQKSPLLIKKKNNQNNMHTCFEKHIRSIHMHVCHTYCQFQYISKTKSPFANIQASFDKQRDIRTISRDIRTISRDIRTISEKTGVFCYFFLVVLEIFFHDLEGLKDLIVFTSRSVTYFEKGFIRGLENFHLLSRDVHIVLNHHNKSYAFCPLCHDVHTLWRRRIKS